MIRRAWVGSAVLVVALVCGAVLGGDRRVRAQGAPLLTNEGLLRAVLPLDAAGNRPLALAWARYDDTSARDGSPQVFVALIYETPAPFGTRDVRRILNRVDWTGTRYEPLIKDEPGEVLEGELTRFGLAPWSLEIDIASNRSEGNPFYTVTYKGRGPLPTGANGVLTLTELVRPFGRVLWQRITESRTSLPGSPDTDAQATTVRYRFESGGDQLIADVAEMRLLEPMRAGGPPSPAELRLFTETWALIDGEYRLESRTVRRIP